MVYSRWTRETYLKLDKLVKKKASPGDMAVAMKVDKKDLSYRLHLLKTKTNIQTWTEEELDLLEHAKNLDAYLQGCFDLFGKHHDKNIYIQHWMNREKYLAAWYKEKDERKKIHNVDIPNKVVVQPRTEDPRKDQLPDIGEQMATLISKLDENTAVLKELLLVQNNASVHSKDTHDVLKLVLSVQTDTYTLFKGKLEAGKQNGK